MQRFSLGLVCLVIFTIAGPYYPDSYYLTDDFEVCNTEDTASTMTAATCYIAAISKNTCQFDLY